MRRRRFCQSSVAMGTVAGFPFSAVLAGSRARPDIAAVTLSGEETVLERVEIEDLAGALKGRLLVEGDPGYHDARALWNAVHDRRPALIARCADSEDVGKAVDFAREHRLLTAVRGGGHSYFGRSGCDSGLVIDLSEIDAVAVDPSRRRARVGGGALVHALDAASQAHGLATTTGVVSHIGVGGLSLGGGFGRLNRKLGLTIDNIVAAELVTADGTIRRVSAEEHADLFWGIRGGGGNFGVATALELRLHPVGPALLGGSVIWPIAQARDLLQFWADYGPGLPDDLYVAPFMSAGGEGERGIIGMDILHAGDPAAGEKALTPLRRFGRPETDTVAMVDYLATQTALDDYSPHGNRYAVKTGMVETYTQALIDALVETFRPMPGFELYFNTCGGAIARVAEDATAWPHRRAETMLGISLGWTDPAEDDARLATLEDWWSAFEPLTDGYYSNLREESESRTIANYGPAYPRLAQLKSTYDPMNLFRLNANVKPGV